MKKSIRIQFLRQSRLLANRLGWARLLLRQKLHFLFQTITLKTNSWHWHCWQLNEAIVSRSNVCVHVTLCVYVRYEKKACTQKHVDVTSENSHTHSTSLLELRFQKLTMQFQIRMPRKTGLPLPLGSWFARNKETIIDFDKKWHCSEMPQKVQEVQNITTTLISRHQSGFLFGFSGLTLSQFLISQFFGLDVASTHAKCHISNLCGCSCCSHDGCVCHGSGSADVHLPPTHTYINYFTGPDTTPSWAPAAPIQNLSGYSRGPHELCPSCAFGH